MATANDWLADEAVARAIDLTRYSNGVVRRLLAILNRADASLFAQLESALGTMDAATWSVERLEAMLNSVRVLNAQVYQEFLRALQDDLRGVTETEVAFQARTIQQPLPVQVRPLFNAVSIDQVQAAALARPFQGRMLAEWARSNEADRMTRIRDRVRMGFVEGKTVPQMVKEIRGTRALAYSDGIIEIDRRNAEAVVRTAVSHTAAYARDKVYEANTDLIKATAWRSTLDSRTTQQCFPSGTSALPIGDLRGVSRRHWNGDLVVVTTASGKKLRATPHHPVLTARGWRPIQELKPGADVLYRVGVDVGGVSPPEDIEVPATMGAIFDALNEPSLSHVLAERTAKIDFHGDGIPGEHEVNSPRSKSDLRLGLESAFGHEAAEKLLVLVAQPPLFEREGSTDEFLFGPTFLNVPSEFDASAIQDRVKTRLTDVIKAAYFGGLSPVSKGLNESCLVGAPSLVPSSEGGHHAGPLENSGDGGCADPEVPCDAGGGCALRVVADDVVSLEREFFSGHVMNFQTGSEMYIADGFVVHNCRIRDGLQYTVGTHKPIGHKVPWGAGPGKLHWCCRSVDAPVLKSWKELGGADILDWSPAQRASMDGAVPADMTYAQWLKRQSAARQDEALGPTRGRLYRKGELPLEAFSNDKGQLLTLEQLRKREPQAFELAGV